MNCYILKPEEWMETVIEATAPSYIADKVRSDGGRILTVAGFEEDRLISYALFSQPENGAPEVWLDFFYTKEDQREEGRATELLKFAEEYLKKKRIADILIRMVAEPEEAGEFADFFINRGYLPLSTTGRLMVYEYKDMLAPGVFQFLSERKKSLPKPVSYEEIKGIQGWHSVPVDIEPEDEEFSCFFVEKNAVIGAAAAFRSDERTVCIKEIWLSEEAGKKGYFLPMLHSVAEEATKQLSEDISLKIILNDEGALKGLDQMFNPPEREYLIQEYMKSLITRD